MTAPDMSALRQELAKALEAWGPTIANGTVDSLMPTVVQALADTWADGRESVGLDFLKPLGDNNQRAATTNPFASSGDTTNGDK